MVGRLVGRWSGRCVGLRVDRWSSKWVGGLLGRWVGGSVGRWVGGSVGQWVGGSVVSYYRSVGGCRFMGKERTSNKKRNGGGIEEEF